MYLQQKRVDPFGECLLLYMQTFLLQGLNTALLKPQCIFPLSHSLLYISTTPEFVDSGRWIVWRVVEDVTPCLGCGAKPNTGHILRP